MFLIALGSFWRSRKLKFHGKYWNFIISPRENYASCPQHDSRLYKCSSLWLWSLDIAWAWKHSVQVHQLKGYRDMKKIASCSWILSHNYITASFSEREGDWGSHGMFMPAWWKKIERERSHVGHACQPSIRIVMPGMKMNEMSCKKRTKE